MKNLLKKFRLPYSKGPSEVEALLKKYSKKLPPRSISKASPTLLRKIKKYQDELLQDGRPPYLQVMQINDHLQAGVFLKPDSAPIKAGTFIGLYTGRLELVLANETKGNHYAYDVAQELTLKKDQLALVRSKGKKVSTDLEYSIQTNALKAGNFTRYINHSLYSANIEAITKLLPDGTIEVFLFTFKKIYPGEQLLSNYGGLYWAVLPIIPEEITPSTYKLTKEGSVIRTTKPIALAPDIQKALLPLRKALELETKDLPTSVKSILSSAKLSYVSTSLHHKIEDFDEVILERALPKRLTLKPLKTSEKWGVFLEEGGKPLKKGSFIGVYGGVWTASRKKTAQEVVINKKLTLFLDGSKNSNFTKYLLSPKEGNIKTSLYKKRGPNGLYLVLTASRDIQPGERLSLSF